MRKMLFFLMAVLWAGSMSAQWNAVRPLDLVKEAQNTGAVTPTDSFKTVSC